MGRLTPQQQIGLVLIGLLILLSFGRSLFSNPLQLLFTLAGLVVAITVHEFGHAWVASALGDHTAAYQGRVSLNPVRHFDPVGAMMILFTFASGIGIGWGKPVPVSPARLAGGRHGMAAVALAGAAMNLLTAAVLALSLFLSGPSLAQLSGGAIISALLATVVVVNVYLAVFNIIIALPPLDGYNFLVNVLPLRLAFQVRQLERFGPILLILVILGSQMRLLGFNLVGVLVGVPSRFLLGLLHVA